MVALGGIAIAAALATYTNDNFSTAVDSLRKVAENQIASISEKMTVVQSDHTGNSHFYLISNYGESNVTVSILDQNFQPVSECQYQTSIPSKTVASISCSDIAVGKKLFLITTHDTILELPLI
jgi:hypothetical protein